jgi:HlyD family secretion protein
MTQDVATSAPGTRHRRRRIVLLAAISLLLIIAITLVAVSCINGEDAGPPTVRVDRGPVALAVSASGSIAPAGRQSLGFADGGTVSDVLVRVGDRVSPGQMLARVDDTVARQTLAQRQATLDQQVALLGKLRGGNAVGAAQAALDQAREIERATRAQVDATDAANESASSNARTQLRFDESALRQAEDQLRADRAACRASPTSTTQRAATTVPPGGATTVPTGGATSVPTVVPTTAPTVPTSPTTRRTQPTTRPTATATSIPTVTVTKVIRVAAASPLDTDVEGDIDLADDRTSPACGRLLSDRSAVQQAEAAVVGSQTALDAAEQRERTDAAAGRVSVENARQAVVTAQNQLATAGNDTPADIAAQEALVDDARAGVAIARRDVEETVLTAPVAATIIAINGVAGEVVSAPSAVTPLAPGGEAPLPVESGATGTGGGGAPQRRAADGHRRGAGRRAGRRAVPGGPGGRRLRRGPLGPDRRRRGAAPAGHGHPGARAGGTAGELTAL